MNLYFAPDQDCLTPLLGVISNAKESLTVADYSFSAPAVTDAIVSAYGRGVKVSVLLDKSQSGGKVEKPEIAKLLSAGVPYTIGSSDKHKIMHLKVAVGDNTIAFGSYNFTNAAAQENNVLAVYESPEDAVTFVTQINKAIAFIQSSSKLNMKGLSTMDYKQIALHALRVFVVTFVAVVVASGVNLANLPHLADAEKLGLAALVAGADAVFEQVALPLLASAKLKLGL